MLNKGPTWKTFLLNLILSLQATCLKLPEDYDKTLRPNNNAVADIVNVSLELLSLRDVDESQMELALEVSLKKAWTDPRLSGMVRRETILLEKLQFWTPDLFLMHSQAENDKSKKVFKINPNGGLSLTESLTTTVKCPMSFTRFPFDKHECLLQIRSHAYNHLHLDLYWNSLYSEPYNFDTEFQIKSLEQMSHSLKIGNGIYKTLDLKINIARNCFAYLWRSFIPTLFFALIAYLTLFLKPYNIKGLKCFFFWNKKTENSDNEIEEITDKGMKIDLNEKSNPTDATDNFWDFLLVKILLNGFFLLLTIVIGQMNFMNGPRSSYITALDSWTAFIGLEIFVIFFHNVLLYFHYKMESSKEEKKAFPEKSTRFLTLSIPIVSLIFFVIFFAFYLY